MIPFSVDHLLSFVQIDLSYPSFWQAITISSAKKRDWVPFSGTFGFLLILNPWVILHRSATKMFQSVGDRQDPCGVPMKVSIFSSSTCTCVFISKFYIALMIHGVKPALSILSINLSLITESKAVAKSMKRRYYFVRSFTLVFFSLSSCCMVFDSWMSFVSERMCSKVPTVWFWNPNWLSGMYFSLFYSDYSVWRSTSS